MADKTGVPGGMPKRGHQRSASADSLDSELNEINLGKEDKDREERTGPPKFEIGSSETLNSDASEPKGRPSTPANLLRTVSPTDSITSERRGRFTISRTSSTDTLDDYENRVEQRGRFKVISRSGSSTDTLDSLAGTLDHSPTRRGVSPSHPRFKVNRVDFSKDDPDVRTRTPEPYDENDTVNSNGPSNEYTMHYKDDATTYIKTFGQNTVEKIPNIDHYRNLLSTTNAMISTRPSLLALHDAMEHKVKRPSFYSDYCNLSGSFTFGR